MSSSFLQTDCRSDLPPHICDLGNVFAVFWQLIGFTAILPQIHLIWQYQSVRAVHVLWPTMLFTASLAYAFNVFAVERRLFFKLAAVYYPIVYFILLVEFWLLTKKSAQKKLLYAAVCTILWACLLTIGLTVNFSDGVQRLNWISIVFYSVKIIPQLLLNIFMRTTSGQSSISVLLYCMEASCAFLSTYLLEQELEYRVMHYMSTSLYYINGIQVAWYVSYRTETIEKIHYGSTIHESQDYSAPFEERNNIGLHRTLQNEELEMKDSVDKTIVGGGVVGGDTNLLAEGGNMVKVISSCEGSLRVSLGEGHSLDMSSYYQRLKMKSCWEIMLLFYLVGGLGGFTIALCVTANTFRAICGPVSMFGMLFISSLIRDCKDGALQCPCYY